MTEERNVLAGLPWFLVLVSNFVQRFSLNGKLEKLTFGSLSCFFFYFFRMTVRPGVQMNSSLP